MGTAREHVKAFRALCGKTTLRKKAEIPCQCGGIAGDIDKTGGGKVRNGVYERGGEAFARRIHDDGIWQSAAAAQLGSRLCGIGAEEFHVVYIVFQI